MTILATAPSRRILILFLVAVWIASTLPAAERLTFTVVGIDCQACAPPILRALKAVPGVKDPRLDWKAGLASVDVPEGFDRERLRAALQAIGYEAVFPGEQRRDLDPLPEDVRQKLDISAASEGERFDVGKTLVPGKVTILDYWAEWCSPCHLLDLRLQRLVHENPRFAVRRVNVGKWDNGAARQATSEFRVQALPYVRVYDTRGKFIGAERGGSWDRILKLLEKAQSGS